ncbi:MAG: S41 family peptidase [Rhodoferax sp.]
MLASLLEGCGGGSASDSGNTDPASDYPSAPLTCALADQRAWLQSYMADQYYWYDQRGSPNAAATDMDGYFQSLLAKPQDRYSFSESTAQFNQFFTEGKNLGYGYMLAWADASMTTMKVLFVEPRSPVGLAGLRRGDSIVSIDGYSPAQIAAGTPGRASAAGIARTFVIRDASKQTRQFTVSSAEYAFASVPASAVLAQDIGNRSVPVGYLVYQQFVSASAAELADVLQTFATAGVRELVVDLRYNGGGSVALARDLATLVGGSTLEGKTFAELRFNRRHPASTTTYTFRADGGLVPVAPLQGLTRVVFIAGPGTASASELVINGLKPFLNVALIGATTYGKPYGFVPVDACSITYNAVNFEAFNALGVGGYSSGIAPDCAVADDPDHALGDPAEGRLSAALYYLRNGSCPPTANKALASHGASTPTPWAGRAFGEIAPARMLAD